MNPENFINNGGGFAWFTGVVEDIDDPMEMGRYRVRCFGYHNADKTAKNGIPTKELPWATTMLPVTSASMSGVGQSATGLLCGTWVIGFFRDGINAQDPVIMGSIPTISTKVNYSDGFTDPNERYPSKNKLDTPDTPVCAQVKEEKYKEGFSYTKKVSLRDIYDKVQIVADKVRVDLKDGVLPTAPGGDWLFPAIDDVMTPTYPQNHVTAYERANDENEAAHIVEYDVTPGKERISTIHRTGTYTEVTPIGDKTEVIVGKNYKVVAQGENVYIEGGCNLTIDGGCNTKIIGDWNIQVTGSKYEHIGGTHVHRVGKSQLIEITGSITENTTGTCTEAYGGNQVTTAPNIFLN